MHAGVCYKCMCMGMFVLMCACAVLVPCMCVPCCAHARLLADCVRAAQGVLCYVILSLLHAREHDSLSSRTATLNAK